MTFQVNDTALTNAGTKHKMSSRIRFRNQQDSMPTSSSSTPLRDAMVIKAEDMAACTGGTICPKGPYLATVIRKYMQQFGAKPAGRKLQVKPRRDAGLSKNPDDLKAQRQARGAAEPEAATCQKMVSMSSASVC
jgi:hypothetical protein